MNRQEMKKIRQDLKLTQEDFAARIGISRRRYIDLEFGLSRIRKIHENAIKWVQHESVKAD